METIYDEAVAVEKLKALVETTDTEVAHHEADAILVAVLRGLGRNEIADAYDQVDKWYA